MDRGQSSECGTLVRDVEQGVSKNMVPHYDTLPACHARPRAKTLHQTGDRGKRRAESAIASHPARQNIAAPSDKAMLERLHAHHDDDTGASVNYVVMIGGPPDHGEGFDLVQAQLLR